jgi:hypothetical protein
MASQSLLGCLDDVDYLGPQVSGLFHFKDNMLPPHEISPSERISLFWSADNHSFHSPETICAVTELSSNTMANWRCQGKGPVFFKSGKQVYYQKSDVVDWFKSFQSSIAQAA